MRGSVRGSVTTAREISCRGATTAATMRSTTKTRFQIERSSDASEASTGRDEAMPRKGFHHLAWTLAPAKNNDRLSTQKSMS